MNTLLFCSAVLVLLFAALSLHVSLVKRRSRKDPGVTEAAVTKAIRAQGNAAEYIPLFVALFLYFNATRPDPGVYLMSVAVLATVSRFAHAAGMLLVGSVAERHPLRFCGAIGTYVCLFALGCALLVRAF